ncbi:MAG: hypothetical protein FGM43_04955 [Sinobacteraceae bacterium]|nr:hypothetical protein [Nevskiaceae bacterium]
MALALRTLKDGIPYQHEMNDALVKMHLNSVQFAKNKGLIKQYVEHDIASMMPTLKTLRAAVAQRGDPEIALQGVFDKTSSFYQLCLDLEASPGQRRFTFPYSHVLAISRRIGQFDLTDAELHEIWLKPRLEGYGRGIGVTFEVSDIGADGKVTVSLGAPAP